MVAHASVYLCVDVGVCVFVNTICVFQLHFKQFRRNSHKFPGIKFNAQIFRDTGWLQISFSCWWTWTCDYPLAGLLVSESGCPSVRLYIYVNLYMQKWARAHTRLYTDMYYSFEYIILWRGKLCRVSSHGRLPWFMQLQTKLCCKKFDNSMVPGSEKKSRIHTHAFAHAHTHTHTKYTPIDAITRSHTYTYTNTRMHISVINSYQKQLSNTCAKSFLCQHGFGIYISLLSKRGLT